MNDFLNSAGELLATIAPTLALALGGPAAGLATTAMIGALGLSPDTSKESLMHHISVASPDQLLQLKVVEQQFVLDLKKLDIDIYSLQAADTANARQREITTSDYTPRILAGLVLALYICINFYIFSGHDLHETMRDIALRSLGTLDAALGLVLSYYFGSSLGSATKDRQISSLTEKIQ